MPQKVMIVTYLKQFKIKKYTYTPIINKYDKIKKDLSFRPIYKIIKLIDINNSQTKTYYNKIVVLKI